MLLPDYGRVYALGKSEVLGIFSGPILVQEKIDGSQFSFLRDDDGLHFRSRNQEVKAGESGQFSAACAALLEREDRIPKGIVFRGENMPKPKSNVLAYQRVPRGHVVLYDGLHYGAGAPLAWCEVEGYAELMNLEVVPTIHHDCSEAVVEPEDLGRWIAEPSMLGGMREGIVVKNYLMVDPWCPGQWLKAKYVAPQFKEFATGKAFKAPVAGADMATVLGQKYRSEARWHKAIAHMRDDGLLHGDARDIGPLMGYVVDDVLAEDGEDIKEALFKAAWKQIARSLTVGLPEWYKTELTKKQFEG
jgi:hypothetical protein